MLYAATSSDRNELDRHMQKFVGHIHRLLLRDMDDKVFPLFAFSGVPGRPPNGIVKNGSVRLLMAHDDWQTRNARARIPPHVVISEDLQADLASFSGTKPPLTSDFAHDTLGAFPYAKDLLICGSDINLSLNADGEKRWVQLYRDAGARAFPNAFCSPGGVWNVSPGTNAVKELNEEIGMVVRHSERHFLLHFSHLGQTGISMEQKQAQLERMLMRLKLRYRDVFWKMRESNFEFLPVRLEPDRDINLPQTKLVVAANDKGRFLTETVEGLILHKEKAHSIIYMPFLKLPDSVPIPGGNEQLDLRHLERGKNLFIVDTESGRFNRQVYCLTAPEIKYALRFERAMMDNTEAGFAAALPADMAPARNIRQWTADGWQSHSIASNPEFPKGGPHTIIANGSDASRPSLVLRR